ncbi:hypothetical protein OIU84_020226 [Salix udensis]|uniref:B box-type domain-containing protein n=1 Tax=Salix udensis TaxID=889485 RepID=A0AAD6L325_9ROSI|nr:hypothetical protein OIU84_020226 [Salix udensis]
MAVKVCELCKREADVYCDSDAAYLCFDCDSNVHDANFLVARHLRRVICSGCGSSTGNSFSGATPSLSRATCLSCSPGDKELDSISYSFSSSSTLSSDDCISSTETTRSENTRKGVKTTSSSSSVKNIPARNLRPEGVFVNWCKRLGLNSNLVVQRATRAMALCFGRLGLPFRVSSAAAFWFGVRLCGDKSAATLQNLRRLEEASGVPCKLIVTVEMKIEQALRSKRLQLQKKMEEGWAECSA